MSIVTCPSDIVAAPASVVWHLVAEPTELARWTDSVLVGAPHRPSGLRAGDRVLLGAGVRGLFRIVVDVVDADAPTRIGLDVRLPFGVVNHEVVVIAPLSASSCRVTFN